MNIINFFQNLQVAIYKPFSGLDGIPLLALRLILAPIMIIAGWNKFQGLEGTAMFFSNIGIPFAEIMAPVAAGTELIGGILLVIGLGVRLISIPLAGVMLVAALTAHLDNGWFAIAPTSASSHPGAVLALLKIPGAAESVAKADGNGQRVRLVRDAVDQHLNSRWITRNGQIGIIQNGIEFAAIYFIMLLVLCFYGGGRYVSLDYYLCRMGKMQ